MTGLHPYVTVDPLWVNVTTSSPWSIPVDWWPVVGLLVGVVVGVMFAGVLISWGRSP